MQPVPLAVLGAALLALGVCPPPQLLPPGGIPAGPPCASWAALSCCSSRVVVGRRRRRAALSASNGVGFLEGGGRVGRDGAGEDGDSCGSGSDDDSDGDESEVSGAGKDIGGGGREVPPSGALAGGKVGAGGPTGKKEDGASKGGGEGLLLAGLPAATVAATDLVEAKGPETAAAGVLVIADLGLRPAGGRGGKKKERGKKPPGGGRLREKLRELPRWER